MIRIDISGPYKCLNREYEVIRTALENVGCKVNVEETEFSNPSRDRSRGGFIKRHEKLNLNLDEIRLDETEVTLRVAEHPWGG